MGYKNSGNRKMTALPLPPPPPPKPPPPAAAEPKSERSQPPAKPKLPHPSLPPLEPGEPDLYCYESLQTENGAAGAGAGGMGGGNGAIKSPDEWGTGPPSSRKRLRNDDDELDEGGSSQDESDEDGEVGGEGRSEASSTLLGRGGAGGALSPGARADSNGETPQRHENDDDSREVGHQLTSQQRANLLDAVLRVCPRVVQSLPLPRERSHESSKRREQRAKARAVQLGLPPGSLGAPSPLSQLGSPGGSSYYADSPSPMPNGHARWPPQPHTAARDGGATWPPTLQGCGASEGSGTYESYDEPTSPRPASVHVEDAETPSPRSPGDATRWLLQLSAGRGGA